MDFTFTDEQELLREQARDYLARYDGDRVSELAESDAAWEPSSWRELAELGWLGVSVPEEEGGAGLTFLEEAVIVEELGRSLYPGPYFSTLLVLPALEGERLERVVAGEARWSIALDDGALVPDLALVENVLAVEGDSVAAITDFDVEPVPTMDATRRFGRISGGTRQPLAVNGDVVDRIALRAATLTAVEAVGVAQRVLELSIEYTASRQQFGKPIGIYQAVSHPLADTYVQTELSRSIAYWAAWSVANDDEQAPVAAAAAKAYATEAAVRACEVAIQVHGGIGFTWEHVLHRYYKRAQWLAAYGGWPTAHRAALARMLVAPAGITA